MQSRQILPQAGQQQPLSNPRSRCTIYVPHALQLHRMARLLPFVCFHCRVLYDGDPFLRRARFFRSGRFLRRNPAAF